MRLCVVEDFTEEEIRILEAAPDSVKVFALRELAKDRNIFLVCDADDEIACYSSARSMADDNYAQ